MSKGSWDVKPSVVERMLNAVQAVGLPVARVEYDTKDGKVTVIVGKPAETATTGNESNEWDGILDGKDQTQVRQ